MADKPTPDSPFTLPGFWDPALLFGGTGLFGGAGLSGETGGQPAAADRPDLPAMPVPTLADVQGWTAAMVRAQTLLADYAASPEGRASGEAIFAAMLDPARWQAMATQLLQPVSTPAAGAFAANPWLAASLKFWQDVGLVAPPTPAVAAPASATARDRRFAAPEWQSHPLFAAIHAVYAQLSERMLAAVDSADGLDAQTRAKLRFSTSGLIEAMSPSNFALTNPAVLRRTIETRGDNLVRGLDHMLADLRRGQLSHVDRSQFTLGVNIAATPGKVVHETPLYQLIQYAPTTETVLETPLVIFPPWINRYYILDLNPEKSFVRWAVEQGITTFVISWKSADAGMADVAWDDYVAAEIDAIATVTQGLGVPSTHAIGYCVAGTTLAATLAVLEAHGEAGKVASATFFTAQVDFSEAGELRLMTDDAHMALLEQLSAPGYLDGRYMAATFNSLRGRDLIWNYVVNNYLMGDDYPAFDMLYWNGDTTNLPARWHKSYLTDLYRDNRLVVPGSLSVGGVPIDLTTVTTPAYIQAGREDHIAPAVSVWKMMDHLSGPKRFVLAGSGHIAGVVNPPASGKYQHWINDGDPASFDAFVAGAREVTGSWWPDWLGWLCAHAPATTKATGARIPGDGRLAAIEDAPGRYVAQP